MLGISQKGYQLSKDTVDLCLDLKEGQATLVKLILEVADLQDSMLYLNLKLGDPVLIDLIKAGMQLRDLFDQWLDLTLQCEELGLQDLDLLIGACELLVELFNPFISFH